MNSIRHLLLLVVLCLSLSIVAARTIPATPDNYASKLSSLVAGDTLLLGPGIYVKNCTLTNLNGTEQQPIVIYGDATSTVFQSQSCCNTVSITRCSYLILSHFTIDGMNVPVDAIKAEGTVGNWAHHITIEYVSIRGFASDQQVVGINTKCSAWNWMIRKNIIDGAGTGMYFGNSNGDAPFVAGIIEYNCISHTIGYNIEIKHQLDTVRGRYPGTAVDAKTVIHHNVFSKDSISSTGSSARPNLLVGGMPHSGWGTNDLYEIHSNFFYNNPEEALFQGCGNIVMYNNIFVNHFDPSGSRAIYLTSQNGTKPKNIVVAHNTIWANNTSGGIRVYDADNNSQQLCFANLVCSPQPITNFPAASDNVVGTYDDMAHYALTASKDLSSLQLFPADSSLFRTQVVPTPLEQFEASRRDFNGQIYDTRWRGAYSGCITNPGWRLRIDTMTTQRDELSDVADGERNAFAASEGLKTLEGTTMSALVRNGYLEMSGALTGEFTAMMYNLHGQLMKAVSIAAPEVRIPISDLPCGTYVVVLHGGPHVQVRRFVVALPQ